ncbi:MFS transporter [Cystobacter fuscus]|nr:MFS transporter [Cystobacter fuscus]
MQPSHSASSLLGSNRNYRNLFIAHTLSVLGDWFNQFSLLAIVYLKTGSSAYVGLTLVSSALPALLLGPFIGALVDRSDCRRVMIISDVARVLLAATFILTVDWVWSIYPLLALMSLFETAFSTARNAIMPSVVDKPQLPIANVLMNVARGMMASVGAALGPIISGLIGQNGAFWLNSASFALSALLISRIVLNAPAQAHSRRWSREDLLAGYRYVLSNPIVLGVFITGVAWSLLGGAYYVLLTVYGAGVLKGGSSGIGVMYGAQGFGSVVGGLLVLRFLVHDEVRAIRLFSWGKIAQVLVFFGFLFAGELWTGAALILLMRTIGGLLTPYDTTLIQAYTPHELLGKVFAARSTFVEFATQLCTFVFGIWLSFYNEPRITGAVFGLGSLVLAVTGFVILNSRASRDMAAQRLEPG